VYAGWAAAMQPANILCRACQQACQYPAAMLLPILCLLWVCDSHSHMICHTLHAPLLWVSDVVLIACQGMCVPFTALFS
jgi:hypothetical protein